jgi:hypothetical protein
MFTPTLPKCNWGKVKDAYVPSVTFCHLTLKDNYDNSRFNLGLYKDGFWFDDKTYSLPFLNQSWEGTYKSPPLNGAAFTL